MTIIMKELIFSVKNIFDSEDKSGCLTQYKADFYHIPAYQRGYKWGSGEGEAVTLLLEDLLSAFRQKKEEYYLQYITVKPITIEKKLEVIDGQQRITTLSIILSVLAYLSDEPSLNYANEKLHYAIRENFFDKYVYDTNKLKKIKDTKWKDFIKEGGEELNKQDIYYLHAAVRKCFSFINKNKDFSLRGFYDFVLNSTKVIVNSIEQHVASETVFKNLNSNQVPLSETELIKALLITNAGRKQVNQSEAHFREVMEVRLGLGRMWDDIQNWSSIPSIKTFYFNSRDDAMHEFLKLVALVMGIKSLPAKKKSKTENKRQLFNFFSKADVKEVIAQMVELHKRLADWYSQDNLYHLIGFCRFAKNSGHNDLDFIADCYKASTKPELYGFLKGTKEELIKREEDRLNPSALSYGEDTNQIHAILLSLSVFSQSADSEKQHISRRFDFNSFVKEQWSLEHIFPQTPEGKKNILTDDDKENIRKMLKDEEIDISDELEKALKADKRDENQKNLISKAIGECKSVHGIGNLCLLTVQNNSELSCGFFNDKRKKILSMLQEGSFVPRHTFDVFSKMFEGSNDDLSRWSLDDIKAHMEHIAKRMEVEA